ncbi:hypothetical protein RN001_016216 [Aquatica leii]|uniref:Endonuclease-reverse transcriptase n=1 Tax=Aquatica leii TaxID=1421715 RepID=A0AAN7PNY4_9COLE|nr:hypothetical protein RN001_016216 [Aquatica leii]
MEMKHLRKIAGKTKWDHVRNKTIKKEIRQTPILERIKDKNLLWYGHVMRMNNDRLTKRIMEEGKPRNRKRGRPRRKWLDQIEEH